MNNNDFQVIDFENIDNDHHNTHMYLQVYIVRGTFVNNMQHMFEDEHMILVDQMTYHHRNMYKNLVQQSPYYFHKVEY